MLRRTASGCCDSARAKRSSPTLHNARHSFARNAARRGVPLSTVKTWGGWRTWEAFDRYNLTEQAHHEEGRRKMEEGIKRETAALGEGERRGPQPALPDEVQGERKGPHATRPEDSEAGGDVSKKPLTS